LNRDAIHRLHESDDAAPRLPIIHYPMLTSADILYPAFFKPLDTLYRIHRRKGLIDPRFGNAIHRLTPTLPKRSKLSIPAHAESRSYERFSLVDYQTGSPLQFSQPADRMALW
jgi:hypothetical protein